MSRKKKPVQKLSIRKLYRIVGKGSNYVHHFNEGEFVKVISTKDITAISLFRGMGNLVQYLRKEDLQEVTLNG